MFAFWPRGARAYTKHGGYCSTPPVASPGTLRDAGHDAFAGGKPLSLDSSLWPTDVVRQTTSYSVNSIVYVIVAFS